MPETSGSPESPTAVRLKSAVRARSLAAEGVALSMGSTAVVVRGAQADTVWRALEPTLRAGFQRSALLERFPARGRPFLAGILDQLAEHGFLRDLEPEPDSLTEAERAAYPHLESATRRPYAALAALRASVVRVRSSCPLLEAEVRRALARAGFGEVQADTEPAPQGPILLTARPGEAGGGAEYVVAADGGLWLTGPRNRPGTPDLSGRLRAWFTGRETDPAHREPDDSALRITRTLVAAQLALALVGHVARSVSDTAVPDDPEFMVTTDELVSEPHTLLVPDPLDPAASWPLPAPAPRDTAPAEPLEVPDRLDAVTHLWDRVFGPVSPPAPEDLSQLPVGLARSGRYAGCGFTTAQARENALVNALQQVVWRAPEHVPQAGTGLGLTPVAAIGAAVGDLVLRAPEERWKDVDLPSPSPAARRLWTALTLRLGVTAELRLQELDGSGIRRAQVVSGHGELRGASAAPEPDACVQEALLRAVAKARLAEEAPDAVLPTASTGTEAVASALARWAFETGRVRVTAPGGADGWRSRGVHAAVAAWT
ncbi:hypothetical protein [Nocardiopsis metallicus]|uniref:YcaO domain-containing protein n=1 Tax=Nocardiopsis metallicus TaxID=179819 RepID=A0A840WKN5_9ACTN|nr:hypothetical protein [Nocardiopsis metallicus]MBB5493561.1 hypothetical protein [Nocardiopsis metallicus]